MGSPFSYSPMAKKKTSKRPAPAKNNFPIIRWMQKILFWTVVAFFGGSIFVTVVYKWVPVYITPLMVIRCIEQKMDGEPVRMEHTWVPLSKMSRYMPVAVMASEDQLFLEHNGFDLKAISDALEERANGKRMRGASTISQQTAKNVFLWPESSWLRKGLEAYFTFLIEKIWGKERIMEVYLNSIEMGPGIYGAEAVAQAHFQRSAIQLERSQCALIAATLPNPLKYSSKYPSSYMMRRQTAIGQQMKHINLFPTEE